MDGTDIGTNFGRNMDEPSARLVPGTSQGLKDLSLLESRGDLPSAAPGCLQNSLVLSWQTEAPTPTLPLAKARQRALWPLRARKEEA